MRVHRLHARGAVDVRDGAQTRAPLGPHRKDARHEAAEPGATGRQLEVPIGELRGNGGGVGAELLPPLDAQVEAIARARVVRRRQDAAMAERAGTELGRALHPARPPPLRRAPPRSPRREPRRWASTECGKPSSAAMRASSSASATRTPERMIGNLAIRLSEMDAIGVEGRAQRAAGVARRGRDEQPFESALREQPRVGAAVERHAAAEAEIGEAGLGVQAAGDVDQHLLEHRLRAGRDVGVARPLRRSRDRSPRRDRAAGRRDR